MNGIIIIMVLAGLLSFLYIWLYKYIENRDTLFVTLIRYDQSSNTTFTKEIEVYRDHENNFVVKLNADFPRYVCCCSMNKNRITLETNKKTESRKIVHYIITQMGLIKIYEA